MVGLLEDTSDLPTPVTIEEALLYQLCVNGGGSASASSVLDFSNGSFKREGAVELFRSLKSSSGKIILTGNPCVTGEVVVPAGRYVTVNDYDELCALFDGVALDTEVAIQVNNNNIRSYPSLEEALMLLERETYPLMLTWREISYDVETLTEEDKAIATNKGWSLTT